ncbi:MAG: N-formylglutamate amidohydrolase [bacterium]
MVHRSLLISCEHAGNEVPEEWVSLFRGKQRLLQSHRGWDPGALETAETFARVFGVLEVHTCRVTRLLADPNRSLHNPAIWSEITRGLAANEKERILSEHWRPYRIGLQAAAEEEIERRGWMLHLSVHTFTPVLNGVRRTVDVGFLYDPADGASAAFCKAWRRELALVAPELRARFNAPYRGTGDGVVTAFRRIFGLQRYLGIELEINQRFTKTTNEQWKRVRESLAVSFDQVYHDFNRTPKSRNSTDSPRA